MACATTVDPSKNEAGRTPFVRSMIWEGMINEPGVISSRREPTAENAIMARTPRCLRAAMFARDGTLEGEMVWPGPCRATKAMRVPEGRAAIVIGLEGCPQGYYPCFSTLLGSEEEYARSLGSHICYKIDISNLSSGIV